MLINIILASINASYVPWVYKHFKDRNFQIVRETGNKLLLYVGLMCFFMVLIAPEIISVMGTEEYMEAVWIVPAVTISAYFTYCYGLFSNIEFYYSATHFVMLASSSGAIVNIILNMIFIPRYGFISAGYTTLICYALFMVMHYFFARNVCKKQKIPGCIYDIKIMFLSCGVLIIILVISLVLYHHNYFRYLFIVCLLIMYFRNSKVVNKSLS